MNWKTRSYCENLTQTDIGKEVELSGWVDTIRDHGHLLFMHLRDVSGVIQIVFDANKQPDLAKQAFELRNEFVISCKGIVVERSNDTKNPHIKTGNIEVEIQELTVLNTSQTPPFQITEKTNFEGHATEFNVDEDIRLTYRYLDLRRPKMQHNLRERSRMLKIVRDILHENGFNEVETPVLTKSTPEGARDYLVPSRTQAHHFYALPQSPQLFKQLLMISGMDRYFQITKCFRDEDLRPNRQPEFTQIDLEASFIDEEFIYQLLETIMVELFKSQGKTVSVPFPRMTYKEAMDQYGSDAPDLRFGLEMVDCTSIFLNTDYKILKMISNQNGLIKGMNIKGQAPHLSKNELQNEFAMKLIQKMGGKGMTWMKVENGELVSNIVQFFSEAEKEEIKSRLKAEDGDVLVFVADTNHQTANEVLGRFRRFIAERQNLVPKDKLSPVWVTDFPLFEKKEGRFQAVHHPFTSPSGPLQDKSDSALLSMTSRGYDLVINGEEIGGGSIRIHDPKLQAEIFEILGLSESEIKEKFGFFVNALTYGAPPHGGLALGVDRLMALLLNQESIREVIAFPKNRVAYCPLTEAPSSVDQKQLDDLHIQLKKKLD